MQLLQNLHYKQRGFVINVIFVFYLPFKIQQQFERFPDNEIDFRLKVIFTLKHFAQFLPKIWIGFVYNHRVLNLDRCKKSNIT